MDLLINFQSLGVIFAIMFIAGAALIFIALGIMIIKILIPSAKTKHVTEHQKAQMQIRQERQQSLANQKSKQAQVSSTSSSNSQSTSNNSDEYDIDNYQQSGGEA